METRDIIFLVVIIIYPLISYLNSRLYKQKSKLLEERIEYINNLYMPVLIVIMNYYADKEDYSNAQKCKELMDTILEMNKP